jgi:hypothetical protein
LTSVNWEEHVGNKRYNASYALDSNLIETILVIFYRIISNSPAWACWSSLFLSASVAKHESTKSKSIARKRIVKQVWLAMMCRTKNENKYLSVYHIHTHICILFPTCSIYLIKKHDPIMYINLFFCVLLLIGISTSYERTIFTSEKW